MEWFIAVVAIAALGVAAMAAAGGVGEMSPEPVYDVYRQDLPEGPLGAEDIRGARFGLALRGYAMAQVDELLDRLAAEVAERDARIAELTGAATPPLLTHDLEPRPDGAPAVPASPHLAEGR
jgi:DivIVA domain-containing protein